ncbi:MAG: thioredoxin [Actinobacteria bacterium]|nr:thioredoxin [Actinomycetota bacterium]
MATTAVTTAEWTAEVLEADRPVLVDFWAEWCGPCRIIAPIVDEIGTEHNGSLKVVKLNVDENPQVARQYGVMSIPTLIVFQDGEIAKRLVGAKSKQALLAELQEFIA